MEIIFLLLLISNYLINKLLRESGQSFRLHVKIVLNIFSGNIYNRELIFLQVIYESVACDLAQRFFINLNK